MSCPSEWTEYNGGCYKLFSNSEYWTVADAYCLAEGGRLTSVHSNEENEFLNTFANGDSFWIGGYPQDDTWVWSDFSEFDYDGAYSTSSGSCLYQSNSHYGNGWSTSSCSSTQIHFICKLM